VGGVMNPPSTDFGHTQIRYTFSGARHDPTHSRKRGSITVLLPGLDRKGRYGLLSVHDWWNQIIWVVKRDQRLTRGVIILAAANQDGGAHVDSTLTPVHEALAADGVAGIYVARSADIEQRGTLENAHFVSLRQMAYEVLNSTSIPALGNSTCGAT
jgi:hypothetical protein